ncbi:O-antigen ligase family protein [Altererythrobacter sp. MF3-039]|uniref:O-antigen ligase family protein n=1 Tax=Altererythrobacter sp. MF3-039 TaxID=3252901 RepID=UPI00390CA9A5
MSLSAGWDTTSPVFSVATAERLICLSLFAALPIFAVTTWQHDYSWQATRYFSLPIIAAELLVMLFAVLGGADPVHAFKALPRLTKIGVTIWLAVAILASLFARIPAMAFAHLSMSLLQLGFGLVVWSFAIIPSPTFGPKILATMSLSIVSYLLMLIFFISLAKDVPNFEWMQFSAGVSNPRQLGFYGIPLLFFAAALFSKVEGKRSQSSMYWLFICAGFLLVNLSGSRAGLGASVIGCVFFIAMMRKDRVRLLVALVSGWLTAVVASAFLAPHPEWGFWNIMLGTAGINSDSYSSGRVTMWLETIDLIRERALIGHGEGQFRLTTSIGNAMINHHPHNSILQFLYQWGLVGTGAIGVALFPLGRRLREQRPLTSRTAIALVSSAIALIAMSMLEGSLFYAFPTMIVVLAMVWITLPSNRAAEPDPHR